MLKIPGQVPESLVRLLLRRAGCNADGNADVGTAGLWLMVEYMTPESPRLLKLRKALEARQKAHTQQTCCRREP